MVQRPATKVYPLHWEFPGGKVEPGESEFEALKRELDEELSLEIQDASLWFAEVATYSNGMTYSLHYFLVHEFRGEPVNREFAAIRWISREELPSLLHLSGNARIIGRLLEEGIPA